MLPYPQAGWMRAVSLLAAVGLTLLITAWPRALASSVTDVQHGPLTLIMWGIAAGFVHGVGFVPRLTIWRIAFHPLLAWLCMGGGAAYTFKSMPFM